MKAEVAKMGVLMMLNMAKLAEFVALTMLTLIGSGSVNLVMEKLRFPLWSMLVVNLSACFALVLTTISFRHRSPTLAAN